MNKSSILLAALLIAVGLVLHSDVFGQTTYATDKGYTINYLDITSVRNLAAGNVTLLGNDPNDLYTNPARLVAAMETQTTGVSANYIGMDKNTSMLNGTFSRKFFENFVAFLGLQRKFSGSVHVSPLTPGTIGLTNNPFLGEDKTPRDNFIVMGAAFRLSDTAAWSFSLSGRYLTSNIANGNLGTNLYDYASTTTFTVSAFHNGKITNEGQLIYGIAISNVPFNDQSSMLQYSMDNVHHLQTIARFSGAYSITGMHHEFTVAVDMGSELTTSHTTNGYSGSVGAEYVRHIDDIDLSFRAGFGSNSYYSGPSLGAGVGYKKIHINFAYLTPSGRSPSCMFGSSYYFK